MTEASDTGLPGVASTTVDGPVRAAAARDQRFVVDSAMSLLERALDPTCAGRAIEATGIFKGAGVVVVDVRLVRHKPRKRALIAYDLDIRPPGSRPTRVPVLGKMRAGHRPRTGFQLLDRLWQAGFDARCPDGISVPQPLGVVPDLDLWLQRRVSGIVATTRLIDSDGPTLARRIADAAHKLHCARAATRRVHGMDDELSVLHRVLGDVAAERPDWRFRLAHLLEGCRAIARVVTGTCGIHRDFYGDQVLVDEGRLHLVDFDLYCVGPPALDPGNFIGHLLEHSIREPQHGVALIRAALALEDRSVQLVGPHFRRQVRVCAALTLARHVYLSTIFPGRAVATRHILEHAERLVAAEIELPGAEGRGQRVVS